jgi:hypothetical protein
MNRILTIVPESLDGGYLGGYSQRDVVRASFSYLHGDLESMVGYDIFSILKFDLLDNEIDDRWVSEGLKEGIYQGRCLGKEVTYFRWKNGRRSSGLVVLNTDKESYQDALKKYKEKADFI